MTLPADSIGGTERLSGIRVLEIGEMVSAPYAAKLLADLGADVIKVEPPEGDRARHRGPYPRTVTDKHKTALFTAGSEPSGTGRSEAGGSGPAVDPDRSGLYLALNTNKRSVVVTDDQAGRDRLSALVSKADIIVTNHGPDRLAAIGFDPEQARIDRPELVICSVTAFGLTGPYAGFAAEELTVAHGGGWAYQCPGASAEVEEPPLKVFGHQTEFHAGMASAMVCLAAYDRAERTGLGDHIDFSSMAHTAGMLEAALISSSYMDASPNRLGSRLLNPWRIFNCKAEDHIFPQGDRPVADELIFLVTVEQDQWERLVELMGTPEWTKTGLFDTTELRLENEDLLTLYIEEWTSEHTVEELWHRGQAERICFAPVFTMADMETQEHLTERGFFVDVEHPVAGTIKHLGPPFLSHPKLWGPLGPAPTLDEQADPTFGPGRPRVASKPEDANDKPLAGVRVLDLSWVWAGPYCGLHLAYLGAEVIKVESAKRPGLGRRLPLHPPDVAPTLNTSAYFNQWDQAKLSVEIDFSIPEGQELVRWLASESDVVIENFATGVMEKLGLGYRDLAAMNPGIIMASISGYGSSGPLRNYMGYGPTTGPLSGLTSLTGYEGGPPQELGISIGDPAAGITAAFAICAAIVAKRISGQGCYIDTALWESTASNAVEGWMAHAMGGDQPARSGNRDPLMAPHGCYRTGSLFVDDDEPTDGEPDPGVWVTIACRDDEQWRRLATKIDPALADDKRFRSLADRKTNEDELDEIVGGWVNGQDRWDVTKALQADGIAAFPTLSSQDLLVDEHLVERGFFAELKHHEVGVQKHTGIAWRSAVHSNEVERPAPLIGQHTSSVLADVLGLTEEDLAKLRASGVTR